MKTKIISFFNFAFSIFILLLFGGSATMAQTPHVTVGGSIYGGGALANVSGNSTVLLDQAGATVTGNVFGGALGQLAVTDDPATEDVDESQPAIAALVEGAVTVTVEAGTVTGAVFGCNDVNGTPKSTVTVTINGTDTPVSGYAIGGVYGGGNLAHYDPTDDANYPVVTVNNCSTSVRDVFGGGNAAAVTATSVTINGGDIDRVFAGGNGASGTPAHVGWKNTDASPSTDSYGAGTASATIHGGTINQVFSGSNANGVIRETMGVSVSKSGSCAIAVSELYGGGNMAPSQPGTIAVDCMEAGDMITDLYGGANQANITGDITLNITKGRISNVYGGNNTSGTISGDITVNINKDDGDACASNWYVGNVFGGGNQASYSGTPDVNMQNGTVSGSIFGGGNQAGVGGSDVVMTGGTVLTGVYGGCNSSGSVDGDASVSILGGTIGSSAQLTGGTTANVFGGGFGESTSTTGNVTVTISRASGETPPAAPTIYGDVYGGSALGSVNSGSEDATTVNILDGSLMTATSTVGGFTVYTGGNVFGGGLGQSGAGNASKGQVNGTVTVNIGSGTLAVTDPDISEVTDLSGNATIGGNVYGCNNTNGSPQQNVVVNIFKTAQTEGTNTVSDEGYALNNVFGGGNAADFQVAGKTATVKIWGCDNTIGRTFGGGNAAATNTVYTMIQGGRIGEAFSGGNGEVTAANVAGDVNLTIHGGNISSTFGGSNQNGTISGLTNTSFDSDGPCPETQIDEYFCGGKFADYVGDIDATINCAGGMNVKRLYGGCKQAHVRGNVTLTVVGGNYDYIYGGSEGTNTTGADIQGDVTLNVYGGTVKKAIFGGSNIKGAIGGSITVNVEDKYENDACELDVSLADVYGGGNQADYPGTPATGSPLSDPITHSSPYNYPEVNIKNAVVKNVFGGALNAAVTGNPQVHIKNKAKVLGNVYGGGNMGVVNGNPRVVVNGKWE